MGLAALLCGATACRAADRPPLVSAGAFIHIYDPSVGEKEKWYINDHCLIHGSDGLWHLFGITHQEPAAPLRERIFAHATGRTLLQQPWDKQPAALAYAPEPPWNEEHLWAPHVVQHDGLYYMFYCAGARDHSKYKLHLVTSKDLRTWTRHQKNPLVVDGFDARDPFVMREAGRWILYYTANSAPTGGRHVVKSVTSSNLVDWSDTQTVYTDPSQGTYGGPTESPFVVRRGTNYYLFVGPRPDYDGTDVFVSNDPFQWRIEDKVGHIPAHAAEVVRDRDGKWHVSRCGWGRGGVYLAPLTWQDGLDDAESNLPPPKPPGSASARPAPPLRAAAGASPPPMVFPGREWSKASPESQGIDPAKMGMALEYLSNSLAGHGGAGTIFIARNGHAVWQGPDCDREFQIFSATKSVTGTMLGLLIDQGRVTLETRASEFEPALAAQYPAVTLRHFANMTSGYDAAGGSYEFDAQGRGDSWNPGPPAPPLFPPGAKFRYWDDAMSQFGNVLTKAAGQPLDQWFRSRIAEPIGMTRWRWTSNDTPAGRVLSWTGGLHASSRELARFGHLFLNRGNWNGRQLVSASWVDQATTPQVASTLPNDALPRSRGAGVYGLNWWVNGVKPDGQRLWPGAPPRTFYANGLHNNVCIVVPEWRMVIARVNGPGKNGSVGAPANVDEIWSGFFTRLARALTS